MKLFQEVRIEEHFRHAHISEDCFAPVLWHPNKKTNAAEWSEAIRSGKLTEALRSLNPHKKTGPWTILCDGESFLRATACVAAYGAKNITLWDVPAKSPDLNPVEKFWAHVRRWLRAMDLADLRAGRPAVQKTILKERAPPAPLRESQKDRPEYFQDPAEDVQGSHREERSGDQGVI